ncbi:MAG: thermonuclease family protein [Pseudomonadota bacterium]
MADADSLWIGRERHRHDIIDAPEIGHTAKCDAEIEIGLAARDRLSELLADGFDVRTTGAKGRYGRTLSTWWLPDGREAGEVLLDEGLAVVWPQRRDWCR